MARSILLAALVGAATVSAQVPLFQKKFSWNNLPYQADTDSGDRGTQQGYNRCNSTTEGPNSMCQTATVNTVGDFCLWGPPKPDSLIGDTEGESVAWCTQPGRGTRIIPAGAITGVTFVKTPDYIQVTGHINQNLINIKADDGGGELDPHGADQRGNPLGGLMYSNNLPKNPTPGGNNFQQVFEWHNFMGSNIFCMKLCDPTGPRAAELCQHVFDRIGCQYNAPAAYVDGVFESCEGESQDPPGVYTTNGAVVTYAQPPESLGPISTMPYTARIPKSSNCVAMTSSVIFASAPQPSVTPAASSSAASSAAASSITPKSSAAASGTKATSSSSGTAKSTATSSSGVSKAGSIDGLAMFSAASMGILAMIAGVAML